MHGTADYSISDLAELSSIAQPTVYRALGWQGGSLERTALYQSARCWQQMLLVPVIPGVAPYTGEPLSGRKPSSTFPGVKIRAATTSGCATLSTLK
jgi:hypothetical protein